VNDGEWRQRRRDASAGQAARAARAREIQTARAREMVTEFAAEARRRGLATAPLVVRAGDSRRTYRTGLTGWYLNRDGSIGVSTGGGYFILVGPRRLTAHLTGVHLQPSNPPLQVGAGARDGESIALDVLLAMRLAAGDDWPILR
jgi:hypothetical protein